MPWRGASLSPSRSETGFWIPDAEREQIIELALVEPELLSRELALCFSDARLN
jgi:hypothetical protein